MLQFQGKYGVAKTITFPLLNTAGDSIVSGTALDFTGASGVVLSKDSGAFAQISSTTTYVGAAGHGVFAIEVPATAMEAKRIDIIVRQETAAASRVFKDQFISIETHGSGGEYAHDLSTAISTDVNMSLKKNETATAFPFYLVDDTDGKTPETGIASFTSERSIDGAAFAACNNTASEVGEGWYKINLVSGDTNGNVVIFRFSSAGCRTANIVCFPVNPA